MTCPKCNAPNKVIEVKNTYSGYVEFNHRFLMCTNCGYSGQSFEKFDLNTLVAPPENIKHLFPNKVYHKADVYLKFKDKKQNKKAG